MKLSETAEVLTRIAAVHRSTVGKTDVASWHDLIGDLEYADALEAVRRHYRESSEWITPAHLRALVRSIRRDRLERGYPALEPPPADARDYGRELRARVIDIASRKDITRVLDAPARRGCPPELRDDTAKVRIAALDVACPHCGAVVGEWCHVPNTDRRPDGGVHEARVKALGRGESA